MPVDYGITWSELHQERMELADQRATLETDLVEIGNKIAHLDEVLKHLEPLAGFTDGKSIAGLGLTDSIRVILKNSNGQMSARDVRKALDAHGFDMSKLTQPMASIYKVLARLVDDSQEAEREKDENGSVFYRWKIDATTITDDDIPF